MDDQGWVPIKLIAGFNKVSCLGFMIVFICISLGERAGLLFCFHN